MAGLKRRGQELAGEKLEVVLDGKYLSFVMKMFHRRGGMATGDHSKAVVLHSLKFLEMRWLQVRRVDGSSEVGNGGSQRFVRQKHIFRRTPPIRTCQGLKDLEAGPHFVHNPLGVGAESEVGV